MKWMTLDEIHEGRGVETEGGHARECGIKSGSGPWFPRIAQDMDIRLCIVFLPDFRAQSFEFEQTMRARSIGRVILFRMITRQACEEPPLFRVWQRLDVPLVEFVNIHRTIPRPPRFVRFLSQL